MNVQARTTVRQLVGSGDRIGVFMLPFVVVGLGLNIAFPAAFDVGGPPPLLQAVSLAILVAGIIVWAWSVVLILAKVLGIVMYVATRIFAPAEEAELARDFGDTWDQYASTVWLPWV